MRSLIILVATTAVVSGLRDMAPGFSVDFRTFGGSPGYREQRLPDRDLARSFREPTQPAVQHQRQSFREETFRDYRQPFSGREETVIGFPQDIRSFKDDGRSYKDENRESFIDELRNFNVDSRQIRDETRIFKDGVRGFRDESVGFREPRTFSDESRAFRDGPRHFRDEGAFRDERRSHRDEIRPYRDEYRTFRDESRPYKDDYRHFESPRNFREELRSFRDETEAFRDGRPFKEELGPFRNEPRPLKEESGSFRNEPRPFKEESGPFRHESRPFGGEGGTFRDERPFRDDTRSSKNGPRPFKEDSSTLRNEVRTFGDESGSFKDEILFTQESQSLAGAHNRYTKEQEHRPPLSFGGHSNYLKYGNHGLGFTSIPAAVLPLEDGSSQGGSELTRSEMSKTAATQSPGTSSSTGNSDLMNHNSVTIAPEFNKSTNNDGNNEKVPSLADEASTGQASTTTTISTSGRTNVTPKVVFGSGSASMSNSPMVIANGGVGGNVQQSNVVSNLHASTSPMHTGTSTNSYFPSDATPEVPAAFLNYIFKYQQPQETKMRYVYRQSLPSESFNHIQTLVPSNHHQTAKYGFLPEFKIPTSSGIQQPGGTINYVPANGLSKVSYLNANSPSLTLGTSYSTDGGTSVNFGRNVLQLDQGGQFSLGQTEQLSQLRPIEQTDQFTQLRQLGSSSNLNQLGQYGQFGQVEQTRTNNPFNQGGLQLQLGGFGGIDYSALSSNSEASRASPAGSLGIAKVGLSFPESLRPPAPAFTKSQTPSE